jgi:hypothetical protein
MAGWQDGRMAGCQMAGWQDGRMAGWQEGGRDGGPTTRTSMVTRTDLGAGGRAGEPRRAGSP